jgi:FKBP-type peptidyl-prolyl cis-trans isomerase 2
MASTSFYSHPTKTQTATKDPGQQPFTFTVGRGEVIKAWDEGVIGMSIGEIAKIHASADYAYGSGGFPAWGIMPNRYVSQRKSRSIRISTLNG